MDFSGIIPHYQPLPFPAPVWLLQTLLVVGFFLHVIPMNVVLGGTPLAAVFLLLGRKDRQSYCFRLGATLASSLPLFISFAITQGIVPLLFLQLLYGPMYYTSSILIAVPWLAIIAFLMIGYYAAYMVIYRYLKIYRGQDRHEAAGAAPAGADSSLKAPLVLFFASTLFLIISYLFTTNMTLMLTPGRWLHLYRQSPFGMNLPVAGSQALPRWLHFLISAFAVSGLAVGAFGAWGRAGDEKYRQWLIRKGSSIFALATLVQVPVGIWFLFSLPQPIAAKFTGLDVPATAIYALSMILALVALSGTAISYFTGLVKPFNVGAIAALLTVAAMCVSRHQLRLFFLEGLISPSSQPVKTQTDLLSVFIVCAVALIFYLVWLVRLVKSSYRLSPSAQSAGSPAD